MKTIFRWIEIPAIDFERAVLFYEQILQIKLSPLDFGNEKMACFPNDEGAISWSKDFKPSSDGVLVSINAIDSIDKMIDRIKNSGGKVVLPKTKIEAENRGYFCLFTDSEGNKLGVYADN